MSGLFATWRSMTTSPPTASRRKNAVTPSALMPVKALSIRFRAKGREALHRPPVFDLVPPAVWETDGGAL